MRIGNDHNVRQAALYNVDAAAQQAVRNKYMTVGIPAAELHNLRLHVHIDMAHIRAVPPGIEGTKKRSAVADRTLYFIHCK